MEQREVDDAPTEAPYAEVVGSFALIFVVCEGILFILMDVELYCFGVKMLLYNMGKRKEKPVRTAATQKHMVHNRAQVWIRESW